MTRHPLSFAIAAAVASIVALATLPGCGGSHGTATPPSCEDRDGLVCNPPGFPYVLTAVAVTDYCYVGDNVPTTCPATSIPPAGRTTARLTEPATGTLCMAGTVAPAGWAVLALRFFETFEPDGTIVTKFHPVAKGITALALTIDSPPVGGITPTRIGGYHVELPSNPGVPLVVTKAGSVVLPLTAFVSGGSPPMALAPDDVQTVGFNIGPGDYDFCVHDFKLLDAAGNEVGPG